jgi:hypothetical protein
MGWPIRRVKLQMLTLAPDYVWQEPLFEYTTFIAANLEDSNVSRTQDQLICSSLRGSGGKYLDLPRVCHKCQRE